MNREFQGVVVPLERLESIDCHKYHKVFLKLLTEIFDLVHDMVSKGERDLNTPQYYSINYWDD